MPCAPSSFLLLVEMPGATSSVLVTSSDALVLLVACPLLLVEMPGATSSVLVTSSDALCS